MNLVVGCPVRDRAWILPYWFEHVEGACARAGVTPRYVFVADPFNDTETVIECGKGAGSRGRSIEVVAVDEAHEDRYRRVWNNDRFLQMVELRNKLLECVRSYEPDLFWSLDSDILTAGESLASALEGLGRFDAVGMKTYMTIAGRNCPSYANLGPEGQLRRPDQDGFFKVDVIMASKLMTPAAYAVDYAPSDQGEDIGWSKSATAAGLRLGWDGRIASKHVMRREQIDVVDPRCGY